MADRAVRITRFEAGLVAAMLNDQAAGGEWFGPGQPLPVAAPEDVKGRRFDYPVAANITYTPKAEASETGLSYPTIRMLADPTQGGLDLLRLAIETVKDKMSTQPWTIRPKDKGGDKAKAQKLLKALARPDGILTFRQWQRCLLEDHLVIDNPCIYLAPGNGQPSLEIIDGATIKLLVDGDGRRPSPWETAYQQILHGMVGAAYTPKELLHFPYNVVPNRTYALGRIEQFVGIVNLALRSQSWTTQYFTEGNIPEALIGTPEKWTPQQVKDMQDQFDNYFSGNTGNRRHAYFVPGGMTPVFTKDPKLKDEMDDWLARIVCFCYGLSPGALVREQNRATAQTQKTAAAEEGLEPIKGWFKDLIDCLLSVALDADDQEFAYKDEEIQDPLIKAQVLQIAVGKPWLTVAEVREKTGELPMTPDQEEELKPKPPPPPEPGKFPVSGPGKPGLTRKPEDGGIGEPSQKLAKRAQRRSRRDRPAMIKQEGKLALGVSKRLHKMAKAVVPQVVKAYGKLGKASDDEKARKLAELIEQEDFDGLMDYLEQESISTFGAGVAAAGEELQKLATEEMLSLANEKGTAWAADHAGERIKDFLDATQNDITATVSKAIEEGWSNQRLADELSDSWAFSAQRAEVIARTETAFADVQGNLALYREAGIEELQWIAADANPCDECDGKDGTVREVDSEDVPPAHPDCVLGGTIVSAAGVTTHFKRWFEGEIIRIFVEGKDSLAVTPNHPVLTRRGWVAACELIEGEDVFLVSNPGAFIRGINPQDNHVETRIEEISDSLLMAGGMASVCVPETAEDFHGDGIAHQEISIVRSDRMLRDANQSGLLQEMSDRDFIITDADLKMLASGCASAYLFDGLGLSSDGIMGLSRSGAAGLGSSASSLEDVGLGDVSHVETEILPAFTESAAVASERLRQIHAALTDFVTPMKIQKLIRGERFVGHVFNLQTKGAWYIAGSIITHNCRCDVIAVQKGGE